jgi:hypothetical protein
MGAADRALVRLCGVSALLAAALASAQERFDHRGSIGLTAATGGEIATARAASGGSDIGPRLPVELGGTFALGDHNELRAAVRLSVLGPQLGWSTYAGLRSSFGAERWKTFFDLDFAAHLAPVWTLGARVAVGLQYDVLPVMGVFTALGGQLGGGAGLRLSFELMAGLQFRTYLLE